MENFGSFKNFAINPKEIIVFGGEQPCCSFPEEPPFATASTDTTGKTKGNGKGKKKGHYKNGKL